MQHYTSFKEIFDYFIVETNPDIYNFDNFYQSWPSTSKRLSYLIEYIENIKVLISSNIFIEKIEESNILLGIFKEILKDKQILEEIYVSASNANGLLKKLKISKGEKKLKELYSHITLLHNTSIKIYKEYPKSIEEKSKRLFMDYPFLSSQTMDDYKAMVEMFSKDLSGSKIFILLNKFVFPYFKDRSISAKKLLLLIERLKNPTSYKTYFTNVQFFRNSLLGIEVEKKLKDIDIFFDKELFIIGKSLLEIMPSGLTPFRRFLNFYDLKEWIDNLRRKNNQDHIKDMENTINHISNSPIVFEKTVFENRPIKFIDNFNSDIIDTLIIFGIKRIHNAHEVDSIFILKKIFIKNNNFKGKLHYLYELWDKIVAKEARNLDHMIIFFQLIDLIGNNIRIFEENKLTLNGANIIDLSVLMEKWKSEGKINLNDIIDNLYNHKNKRKVILVIMPKTDWDMAFSNRFNEIGNIPKDKYEVHYSFVSSALHLAKVIKDVAKYGKIDILIISGHGDSSGVYFDDFGSKNSTKGILDHPLFNNIHKCFSKNAKCYLSSCSTGKDPEGIAFHLSKKFKIPIYAPKVSSHAYIRVSTERNVEIIFNGEVAEFKF